MNLREFDTANALLKSPQLRCRTSVTRGSTPNSHHRRAFTIWELLIAIGLMSVLGILSQRLFVSSFRMMHTARTTETAITRFDHALLRLRADAWSSTQISADGLSATLTESSDHSVTWRFSPTGDLSRTDGATTLTWPDISPAARFSADGPALVLTLPDGFNAQPAKIKLISQLQLAGGGAP